MTSRDARKMIRDLTVWLQDDPDNIQHLDPAQVAMLRSFLDAPRNSGQDVVSAQWAAFNKVLHWINEQDEKNIPKGDLYDAVMAMRPASCAEIVRLGAERDEAVALMNRAGKSMMDSEAERARLTAVLGQAKDIALNAIRAIPGAGPFTETGRDDDWRFRARLARKEALDAAMAHVDLAFEKAADPNAPSADAGSLPSESRESAVAKMNRFFNGANLVLDAEA